MKTSAGLLLYRRSGGGVVEVLIGHMGGPFWAKKDQHAWSVPKGEHTADEQPLAAARREFAEEMGRAAPKGPVLELGRVKQSGQKSVTCFAVEGDFDASQVAGNTFAMEWPPGSGRTREFAEIDRAQWFDLATARGKVVKGQIPFLDRLAGALGTAPQAAEEE